ncbi:hypothetical protein BU24DRAFT_409697 [Aaosphaeria arxii CBS 175.79]|uniref:Uncharacterized protein n=1 Tax=Aaosphaeria arxii CBS 175.79 TaxID=1450172 RepID=A0A6A5XTI4_9PLEO|nr:uncharacterized protein BU24DRAFT_409697 [Aaosphaeria arxii CBS 175.79]KAF2016608.1 hypothetical protein BU24DRAFT_409697 [Aaosphaeria arxii CBS 175.79]
MERDRDRDRDRDRRFAAPISDDRYSNTYRPRSPIPRGDSYRAGRSPPRGRGVLAADTYTPGGRPPRPRSRSPGFRRRSRSPRRDDDRWRARPRSPPRRPYSPPPRRDDYRSDRGRSPRRDGYDSYTRSPRVRDRSLPPRDPSPARSRGMRSPLRPSRYDEPRSRAHSPYRRYSPPRDTRDTRDTRDNRDIRDTRDSRDVRDARDSRDPRDYRRRSPSPPRRERQDPYTADTWRRRSPSPARPFQSNDVSGRESAATSRRSSPPPVHPSRIAIIPDERPIREPVSAPRSPLPIRERDDRERDREYDRDRDFARDRERERERERTRERSPPRIRDAPPTGPRSDREFAPPSGPSATRNGDSNFPRAPPTGPANRGYTAPAQSPPVGPSNTAPQPPAFPRAGNPILAAPTRPSGRGRGGFGYDAPRDFAPRRGSAHWGGRGGGGGFYGGPPSGPRGAPSGPGGGSGPSPGPGAGPGTSPASASFNAPFRGSTNSTSTTYPRTQRFRDHLSDLPKEIPGGQKAPDLYDHSKINKLEDEARRLREMIEAKEAIKRQRLKEWDGLEKDANNAALRADLAEQQLRSLNGEGEVGGAAF